MRFFLLWICAGLIAADTAHAQWTMQDSHTEASLRGIDSVGDGVAWASGTEGTVLRTEDGGATWKKCEVPPGAEALDFRGVQAFDAKTAIVMSSGKGDLSRLYKTTDGCLTWKLVFTNPDKDGFWDAVVWEGKLGVLLGDPVRNSFCIFVSPDGGTTWIKSQADIAPYEDIGAFAASNSSLLPDLKHGRILFITGGGRKMGVELVALLPKGGPDAKLDIITTFLKGMARGESAGAFSLAARTDADGSAVVVVVGGDYSKPAMTVGTMTRISLPPGTTGETVPPLYGAVGGYRSAVTYEVSSKTWITVGPNGTDISTDDGRNWRALKPGPGDAPDADQHWNALSLPFAVGPKGRIGVLRGDALTSAASK